jgi:hypothetical protein
MRRYNQAINPVKKQKGEQLVKFALMLRGGQHYPDDEALALYGAFITDTEAQAAQVRAEHALLAQPRKVFHAIGIDPQVQKYLLSGYKSTCFKGTKVLILTCCGTTRSTGPEELLHRPLPLQLLSLPVKARRTMCWYSEISLVLHVRSS